MTRSRDIAHIRKLCGLPLPAPALAQALLPALRGLVASHSGGVFWVDDRGEMANLYAERLLAPDAMATYYEKHYATAREGFAAAFRRRALAADPVSFHTFSAEERDSAYFQDVLRALDAYHVLYGMLHRGGRAFAQLSLYRGAADRPFDAADADVLRPLLRYLVTGLGRTAVTADADDASVVVEEALGIVTLEGARISAPERWQSLLRLLAVGEVSPRAAHGEGAAIDHYLRATCAELVAAEAARRPAELLRTTPWGRFFLRGFRLADAQGRPTAQFALLIRRQEPKSVAMVKGTGASDLSPQQREVALLLAQGLTNREIADRLGLTLNTAGYHVKQVYARLNVNDRNAVAAELLRMAQHAAR